MKNYKVGDTIYLKALVAKVDKNDPEKTYGVNYVRGMYGVQGWPDNDAIIDELPTADPVKPVLPKDVADEMEVFRNSNKLGAYLNLALNHTETVAYRWTNNDRNIVDLVNAWYNGYTVEKEKKYNLVLGTDGYDCIHAISKCYDKDGVFIDDDTSEVSSLQRDLDYQFTQEEIDKYNKDFWIKNIDLNDYKVEVEE